MALVVNGSLGLMASASPLEIGRAWTMATLSRPRLRRLCVAQSVRVRVSAALARCRVAWVPSFAHGQLGGTAQSVVDARLPARPGRAVVFHHVGIDAQLECLLGIVGRRPPAAD